MNGVSSVGGGVAAEEFSERYQVGVARQALDVESREGQSELQLIAGAGQVAQPPSPDGRGAHVNVIA